MSIFQRETKSISKKKKPGFKKKEEKSNVLQTSLKVTAGIITGAIGTLLLAPQSGKKTREQIKENASDLGEKVSSKTQELSEQVSDKTKELGETTKSQVNNIKEKVKS